MDLAGFDAFCSTFPHTAMVVQWEGAHVWKVAGKVFAFAYEEKGGFMVTFKVTPLSFDILKEQEGLRPAPYMASRGLKWIQHHAAPGLDDEGLKAYIGKSHALVVEGLSRKKRQDLGLA